MAALRRGCGTLSKWARSVISGGPAIPFTGQLKMLWQATEEPAGLSRSMRKAPAP
jgi:hypothetical protein